MYFIFTQHLVLCSFTDGLPDRIVGLNVKRKTGTEAKRAQQEAYHTGSKNMSTTDTANKEFCLP